ncbi:MAG: hypothetical protein KF799_14160 [Bdellovibrionales bacterium]|nr:hypothetical protein [Bdellovibrionales bacterium]
MFSIAIYVLHLSSPWAQTDGTVSYNTSSNKLQVYSVSAWQDIGKGSTLGTCSSAGKIDYNTNVYRYCNGTNWISFSAKVTSDSCATGGQMRYATPRLQFCNGSFWVNTVDLIDGYFVLTNGTWNGNLGDLSGAITKCVSDLTTYNWMGKTDATTRSLISSENIKPFLCSQAGCFAAIPSETYAFARANSVSSGGATFIADSTGSGPGDALSWSSSTGFDSTNKYWSGRAQGSATAWSNSPNTNTADDCNAYASGSGTFSGYEGSPANTTAARWYSAGTVVCSGSKRLVCFVHSKDVTPAAYNFADVTNAPGLTATASSIQQITGIAAPVLVTYTAPAGSPEFRTCSNATCTTVVNDWGSTPAMISPNHYLQLRLTSAGGPSTARASTVNVGGVTDSFTVTTDASIDNTPAAFTFTAVTGATVATWYQSNIIQVTGFATADVTISGADSQQGAGGVFRVCADATCTTVLSDWGTSASMANNQYIQARKLSAPGLGTEVIATVTVGTVARPFSVTTTLPSGSPGYFVAIASGGNGNLGGLAGANTTCLTELTNNNWMGKAGATLNSTKVKAFLCAATCNNLVASTTYRFARVGNIDYGGNTLTTNASGAGPGNANRWSTSDHFGTGVSIIWTGRDDGSDTAWATTPVTDTCTNWTTNSSGVVGLRGTANTTTAERWSDNMVSCSGTNSLICFVNP